MPLDQDGYHDVPPGRLPAVVTWLEMTEPPPARAATAVEGLELRRVAAPGLDWYRDLFRRVGGEWLWSSRLVMPDEALRAILADPRVEVHVLAHEGREVGLLELDRRQPGEVELAFFGLVPEMVGRGAGRFMMDRALALAWAGGPRRVWVHTCTLDHPAALGFYLRSGFRAYRRAVEIAPDPRLTGELPREAAPWLPLIEGDRS